MRRTLWAIGLHLALISRDTVLLLIGLYVIAATLGWILVGLMIAHYIMPPPIGWGAP